MESSISIYQELIHRIRQDVDFKIINFEYRVECFGNFLIEVKYKDVLKIEIINDRSIIQINLSFSGRLLEHKIPLAFVFKAVSPGQTENLKYVYDNSDDVYVSIIQTKEILDVIIENHLQKAIIRKWKKSRIA